MNTDEQERYDKRNFLTWYAMATMEDILKAIRINKKKLIELLNKYDAEVQIINAKEEAEQYDMDI